MHSPGQNSGQAATFGVIVFCQMALNFVVGELMNEEWNPILKQNCRRPSKPIVAHRLHIDCELTASVAALESPARIIGEHNGQRPFYQLLTEHPRKVFKLKDGRGLLAVCKQFQGVPRR